MANQTCNPSVLTQALGIAATGPRTVIVPADPIIWDAETSYEYLTLVSSADFGQAYISKRDVPAGTALTNTEYWIPAASYNAQLAQIQRDIATINSTLSAMSGYGDRITSLEGFTDNLVVVPGSNYDSVSAAIEASSSEGFAVCWPTLSTADPINMVSGAKVIIGNLTYAGTGSAVVFDSVTDATFVGGNIYANAGIGAHFDCTTGTCKNNTLVFGYLNALTAGIDMTTGGLSTAGVMECSVIGRHVTAQNGYVVNTISGWAGQNKIHVDNFTASNYAVSITAGTSGVNGLDFGYTSFEGSTNGIYVSTASAVKGIEGIYGNFRVGEISGKALVISGSMNKFTKPGKLVFDKISNSVIDVSAVTQTEYSYGYICVSGFIYDADWPVITREGIICDNNGICPVTDVAQTVTVAANYASSSFAPIYINAASLEVTIPKWVNALSKPWVILCPSTYGVVLKNKNGGTVYTLESGKNVQITVTGQYSGNNNYRIEVSELSAIRG